MQAMRRLGITSRSVEFCQNEVHIHGICECPEYRYCDIPEYEGQCCTAYEGMCDCMIVINDITHHKYYLNSEEKYNRHYPKTQTLEFKECLSILKSLDKYDCIIYPGKIRFYTKDLMKNYLICEISTE